MICPYCQKEMEKGFLQSRDGLAWTSKKHKIAAFSCYTSDAVTLSTDNSIAPKTLDAYLCRTCKKVIIDYNEQ